MGTDVVELLEDDGARLLHRLRHLAEMGDHLVGSVQEVAAGQDAGAVDRHRFRDDHRRPAQGAFQKVGSEAGARQPHVRHVRRVGSEYDPVAEGVPAQVDRRHHARVFRFGSVHPLLLPVSVGARR